MGILSGGGPLHVAIPLFFDFLILSLLGRIIMSYVQAFMRISPGNPFSRFFYGVTAPIYDPLYKRLPNLALGMFDVSSILVFLVLWWGLQLASGLLISALPLSW